MAAALLKTLNQSLLIVFTLLSLPKARYSQKCPPSQLLNVGKRIFHKRTWLMEESIVIVDF